jgi:hypothetical protein
MGFIDSFFPIDNSDCKYCRDFSISLPGDFVWFLPVSRLVGKDWQNTSIRHIRQIAQAFAAPRPITK